MNKNLQTSNTIIYRVAVKTRRVRKDQVERDLQVAIREALWWVGNEFEILDFPIDLEVKINAEPFVHSWELK